jgi:F-type H+-transporting ATPase subunit a
MKRSAVIFLLAALLPLCVQAEELNVKEFISGHIGDSYSFNAVPLPVILYSQTSGWHFFPSSRFHHGTAAYKGFEIAKEGKYKGKIIETATLSRPLDLSLTKNAAALLLASLLTILIIMRTAGSLRRNPMKFAGIVEMLVVSINDDVIKPSIGKDYRRYAPYLLTLFFFIFVNNLLGLIPGGANVTGNIAVTLVLAVATFLTVNLTGTKEYYKEILWPDVPLWLKVPFPLMPLVEIVGLFTKPFALMIRLFANMMAGHSIVLGLTMLIFITAGMGAAIHASMTVVSIIFTVFIYLLECMIAYIQAYVFTLLSAIYIGLARERKKQDTLNFK